MQSAIGVAPVVHTTLVTTLVGLKSSHIRSRKPWTTRKFRGIRVTLQTAHKTISSVE